MMFDQGSPMAYYTFRSTTTHISSSNLTCGGLACSTSFTVQVPNKVQPSTGHLMLTGACHG